MIEIKEVIDLDENFYKIFFNYCIKSKPYDFCELNSSRLRNFKIKEYYDNLIKDSLVFEYSYNSKQVWYIFLSEEKDSLIVEFAIGDNLNFKSKFLIECLHEIFIFVQNKFNKNLIKTSIQRRYKKQNLINWLKRYDKIAEFIEINEKTHIIWKYERLS